MKSKSIYKNFNFMILWAGQGVSQLGTNFYNIAIMWYVLEKTGSSLAMGISVLCFTLPTVIFGPIGGVLADRYDKKKIIVLTDAINGFIMLILSYFIATSSISIYALYGVMALSASVSSFFNPAISSSIPLIVEEDSLTKANSLTQFTSRLIAILGPALAGILIAITNMWILFLINGISYIISSMSEIFITIPKVINTKEKQHFIQQFKEGLTYVIKNKSVLYLVIAGGVVINFFLAPLTIFVAIISENLGRGSAGLGLIQAFVAFGALNGTLMILMGILKNKYKMCISGLILEGIGVVGLGLFVHNFYMLLFFAFLLGFGIAMASVGISTLYQVIIPKEQMGRALSIVGTLCSVSVPIGALFGSTIIQYFTMGSVLIVSGVIVFLSGLSLVKLVNEPVMSSQN